jgi:hypothetical protein
MSASLATDIFFALDAQGIPEINIVPMTEHWIRVCAWCAPAHMPLPRGLNVTHGICESCAAVQIEVASLTAEGLR